MRDHRCLLSATALVFAPMLHAASTAFHDEVSSDNPVLWYRLNETTGTTIINYGSLGPAFNGTTMSGPLLNAPTPSGDSGVAFLQPSQQWVESGSAAPAQFTLNPTFSIEAVVRVDPSTVNPFYAPFLHWGGAATGQSVYFSLWRNAVDRIYVGYYNGGLRSVDTYNLGCFHHLVWTHNSAGGMGAAAEGNALYVNGIPVELEVDTTLPGVIIPGVTSTTFRVQKATDLVRYFTGTVDEVVLYDHVLTHGEVVSHFVALEFDPVPNCPADLNFSGNVNGLDLAILLAAWSNPAGVVNPCNPEEGADFNCDCKVNGIDLATLLAAWGACPPRT
jgi:hypothetical protein